MERPGAIIDQHVPRTVRLDGLTLASGLIAEPSTRLLPLWRLLWSQCWTGWRMSDLHGDFGEVDAAAGARDDDRGGA